MATETPVVGTIGLKIWINAGLDIAAASKIELRYTRPDGTHGHFDGTYEKRGTEHGAFYITTAAGDVNVVGAWIFQLYVESGPNRFYGTHVKTTKFVEQIPVA